MNKNNNEGLRCIGIIVVIVAVAIVAAAIVVGLNRSTTCRNAGFDGTFSYREIQYCIDVEDETIFPLSSIEYTAP